MSDRHLPLFIGNHQKTKTDYFAEIGAVFQRAWEEAARKGWKVTLQLSIDGCEGAYRKSVHAIEARSGESEIQLIGTFIDLCIAPARRLYSWAMPSEAAIDCLVRHSKMCAGVLEVGAGTGFWAALLSSRGVDVFAVDEAPPHYNIEGHTWPLNTQHSLHASFTFATGKSSNNEHSKFPAVENSTFCIKNNTGCFFPVKRGGVLEAGLHPERLLFLCWPPAWSVRSFARLLILKA